MFPRWLIDGEGKIFKVDTAEEETFILAANPDKFYSVCEHEPTQKDIDYYVFGLNI